MLKDVAEYLTPVLHSSQFASSGVLTPDEFVASGEQLVHACRTWKWEAAAKSAQKAFLPPDRQFLLTRNVPCMCRANAYAMQDAKEELLEATHAGRTAQSDSSAACSFLC